MRPWIAVVFFISLAGCGRCDPRTDDSSATTVVPPATEGAAEASGQLEGSSSAPAPEPERVVGYAPREPVVPETAIADRVAAAHARLEASEAGRLVRAAIDAHGGLERWYRNGPIQFRFNYVPVDGRPAVDTEQLVDTWSSRAVHRLPFERSVRFGWDGSRAWRSPPGVELPASPSSWALTPYYFVATPFVLADAGVNLESAGSLRFESRDYDLVRATFNASVAGAPDGHFTVLVDRETHRVGGVRYLASHPNPIPEQEGDPPLELLAYDGRQTVEGITLPTAFRAFSWGGDDRPTGDVITNVELTDTRFFIGASHADFARPEGAEVIE